MFKFQSTQSQQNTEAILLQENCVLFSFSNDTNVTVHCVAGFFFCFSTQYVFRFDSYLSNV